MKDAGSIFVLGSFVAACSVTVARLPAPGESLRAGSFLLEAGGKGFNLAVGADRLGAHVDGLFAVGRDVLGDFAATELARAGFGADMLLRTDAPTGAGVGFVDDQGENCIAVHPGANDLLSRADVRAAAARIGRSDLVAAQFEIADGPIAEAFALASAAGIPTILNPSPFRPIDRAVLARTRILVVNRIEARQLADHLGAAGTGEAVIPALARRLFDEGVALLVVTAGAGGASAWARNGETAFQPAFRVHAVDSIGAGDAFLAGLTTAIMAGHPLGHSLRRASACGALATTQIGLLSALPTREELATFLAAAQAAP